MQWYFDFAKTNGANTEEQYPYTATDGPECLNDPSNAPTFVDETYTIAAYWAEAEYNTVDNIRAALE